MLRSRIIGFFCDSTRESLVRIVGRLRLHIRIVRTARPRMLVRTFFRVGILWRGKRNITGQRHWGRRVCDRYRT